MTNERRSNPKMKVENGAGRQFLTSRMILLIVVLLPLSAIFIQYLWEAKNHRPPPLDFGSGAMFDQIASRYDMINRVLALRMDVGWRNKMVQTVRERVANTFEPKLLDVATGTADVALLLAKEIPTSTVLGVDPSNGMLAVGRSKITDRGLDGRISLQWGDARDFVALSSDVFDGATMAFGIRNVPERDEALCEIYRVLKDGAVLTILEFSEPDESFGLLGGLARVFIRHVIPIIGGLLSGAPTEYLHLQNSIKDFPAPVKFGALMEDLSCGDHGLGYFHLDSIVHMNFGSVQLYVATAATREAEGTQTGTPQEGSN